MYIITGKCKKFIYMSGITSLLPLITNVHFNEMPSRKNVCP